jgi:predicted O-methyltransferase YrrM
MYNLEALEQVKEKAIANKIPILMDETLDEILEILKEENPKEILEIGTAIGYSASQFAITIPGVHIDTIELSEERANEARNNIKLIGTDSQIDIFQGDAMEILPTFNKQYDVIYIDANKGKYPIYLQHAIRLSKVGTVILADNILYKGYVLGDYNKHKQRTAVKHLREYIAETMSNERLETEILKIGDGLSITRVIK